MLASKLAFKFVFSCNLTNLFVLNYKRDDEIEIQLIESLGMRYSALVGWQFRMAVERSPEFHGGLWVWCSLPP